jgi:hypothetical protein
MTIPQPEPSPKPEPPDPEAFDKQQENGTDFDVSRESVQRRRSGRLGD